MTEAHKYKKFPDLYDNLKILKDFNFSDTDIGAAYINFLTEQRPGRLLSQTSFTNAAEFEKRTRSLKREMQQKTREYFTGLKINMKYHGAAVDDLIKPVYLDEVIPSFAKIKANATIEGAICEILEQGKPIDTIGAAVYAGSLKYTDEKPIFDCRIPYKLFLEYNRIYSALDDVRRNK